MPGVLSEERREKLREAASVLRLILPESVRSFQRDNGLGIASMLAFRGALAMMPLLLLILIVSSQVLFSSQDAVAEVERIVRGVFPQFADAILKDIGALAEQRVWGVLSALVLLWSVTPFAAALRTAFQRIFQQERKLGFVRAKLVDAGTVLTVLLVPLFLVGVRLFYAAAERLLGRQLAFLEPLVGGAAPFAIALLALALVYAAFAPVRVSLIALASGSVTAAALLFLMRPLFAWVLEFNPSYGVTFGSMKAAFLVLVWTQYLFAAVLFGAEVMANVHRWDALLLRRLFAGDGKAPAPGPLLEPFIREYRRDTLLFSEGDAGDEMFYVLSGAVALTRNGETLCVMGPGDHFGEMSVLIETPRTATARVTEPGTRLVAISEKNLEVLLRENPSIVRALLVEMAERLRNTNEFIGRG